MSPGTPNPHPRRRRHGRGFFMIIYPISTCMLRNDYPRHAARIRDAYDRLPMPALPQLMNHGIFSIETFSNSSIGCTRCLLNS